MTRPGTVAGLIAIAALAVLASVAGVQAAYPERPVRVVVPYPAGGTTDIVARIVAQRLSERLGQSFVIDNRSGASGNIGTQAVATATPDGQTLLASTISQAINVSYYTNLPFDAARDLAPVSLIATTPNVMAVNPSVPAKNLTELLALARAKPGQLNFGSTSPGGSPHMSGELLKIMAQVDIVHVPYRGAAPMLTDLVAGQVQIGFDNLPSSLPQIRAGAIRAIAITTATRSASAPEIPTMAESGLPGYEVSGWFGLMAPAGTPAAIVDLLSKQVGEIVREPATRAKLLDSGAEPVGNTAAEYAAFFKADVAKWARVVKDTGLTAK